MEIEQEVTTTTTRPSFKDSLIALSKRTLAIPGEMIAFSHPNNWNHEDPYKRDLYRAHAINLGVKLIPPLMVLICSNLGIITDPSQFSLKEVLLYVSIAKWSPVAPEAIALYSFMKVRSNRILKTLYREDHSTEVNRQFSKLAAPLLLVSGLGINHLSFQADRTSYNYTKRYLDLVTSMNFFPYSADVMLYSLTLKMLNLPLNNEDAFKGMTGFSDMFKQYWNYSRDKGIFRLFKAIKARYHEK